MRDVDRPRSAHNAHTLDARYYLSDEIFQIETDRIFRGQWLCVARSAELRGAGAFRVVDVGSDQVLILRDRTCNLRGFYNVCRHRGTLLCGQAGGQLGQNIQCPYHGWTYDLDGRLIAAPNMPDSFDETEFPLVSVATEEWEGFLLIHLGEHPGPLSRLFQPLGDRLTRWQLAELGVIHEIIYTVDANWKILFQNYSECYHCPRLHPHLNRLTPYRESWNDLDEGPILGGPMRLTNTGGSMTVSGSLCALPLGGVQRPADGLVYYYSFFPSFLLSLFPEYALVHRIERISCGRSRVVCQWLFPPSAVADRGFKPQEAIEFWDLTNRQDWRICEAVQQGVRSSAYRPAPYSDLESMVAAWDREYLRQMGLVATKDHGA